MLCLQTSLYINANILKLYLALSVKYFLMSDETRRSRGPSTFLLLFVPAELGDYQPDLHTAEMVSEFRFVPSQNETMELHVYQSFQLMK